MRSCKRTSENAQKVKFAECPFRGCMKSGPGVVIRYSSTHEKALPDGSFRRRMELHRASHARPHRTRTTQDPRSSRDPKRRLLPPKKRLPVASAPSRLPSMAHRLLVLQEMAHRWYLGEDQPSSPRTPASALEARSFKPSAGVVDSQSVKSTAVGGEERGYDGGKNVKGRLSATSWWTRRVSSSKPSSTVPR